jgi:K+-transporting ATPase KdpF subunit
MCTRAKSCEAVTEMSLETGLSLAVSVLLLIYLAYALLRAEKF